MTDNRIILNVGASYGAFPFKNFLKWALAGVAEIGNVNANGSPISGPLSFSQGAHNRGFRTPSSYAGSQWVFKYTGTQKVRIDTGDSPCTLVGTPAGATVSSSYIELDGANRRAVFTTGATAGNWTFGFRTDGTFSSPGEVILCRVADEAAIDAMIADRALHPTTLTATQQTGMFNQTFVDEIKATNPKALRFMDWEFISHPSKQGCSQPYTLRKPLDHIVWAGNHFHPGVATTSAGGAISGTAAYTCAAASLTPASITAGEMIWGLVSNTNTVVGPTLNVGGRGAKTIVNQFGHPMSVGEIQAGSCYTFAYDVIADVYVGIFQDGNERMGIFTGVPIEVMVGLCNEVGCGIWWTMGGALIIDSDVASMTQYIRNNLNSGQCAYFEYGNETWGGSNFPQDYLQSWGPPLLGAGSFSSNGIVQTAFKSRQLFGIIGTNWSPRSTSELKRCLMSQTVMGPADFYDFIYEGQEFFGLAGTFGYGTAPNRPGDFAEVVGCAPYLASPNAPAFQGSFNADSSQDPLYAAADDYWSGNPTLMANALAWLDAELRGSHGGVNSDNANLAYIAANVNANYQTIASHYDAERIAAGKPKLEVANYEGWLQITRPKRSTMSAIGRDPSYGDNDDGATTGKIDRLFKAYKNSTYAKDLIVQLCADMVAAGANCKHPGIYMFCSGAANGTSDEDFNRWSTHPGDLDTTPYKTYDGLVQWGAAQDGGGAGSGQTGWFIRK